MLYRDSYPRLAKIHWNVFFKHFLNTIGTIMYVYILLQTFCVPYFEESWKTPWDSKFLLTSWFKSMIPGTLLLLLLFFGLLHSWLNMWAAVLRFADRKFYEDWWTVSSFATYYRKWNIVVHEWLFYYVFQDMIRFSKGRVGGTMAFSMVFLISAIFHEIIIVVSFKIFYPILLVMFGGPGVIYTLLPKKESRLLNIFVWSMFFVGNGLLVIFYSWEYFARQSVDLTTVYGWKGWLIPHSWATYTG